MKRGSRAIHCCHIYPMPSHICPLYFCILSFYPPSPSACWISTILSLSELCCTWCYVTPFTFLLGLFSVYSLKVMGLQELLPNQQECGLSPWYCPVVFGTNSNKSISWVSPSHCPQLQYAGIRNIASIPVQFFRLHWVQLYTTTPEGLLLGGGGSCSTPVMSGR